MTAVHRCSALTAVLGIVVSGNGAVAQHVPMPRLTGFVSTEWGAAEVNRCIPDVHRGLSAIRTHGDRLGFHPGPTRDVSRFGGHWQGVQRLPADGGRFLAVSRSGNGIGFVVVKMESRSPDGGRFRSNRLEPARQRSQTPPPSTDRVVAEIPGEPGFHHAGGMQVIGSVLVVPYEDHRTASRVVLYDVRDPQRPVRLHVLDHSGVRPPSNPGQASAAGIVKLADGRYLLVVGVHSSKVLDFYVSTTTSLHDPSLRFVWFHTRKGGLVGGFQSLNFVTQCDGTLFLVGTHNTSLPPPQLGQDHFHWYRVGVADGVVQLEEAGERHAFCHGCSFAAGAAVYVDRNGLPYLYAVEHEDGGPQRSVRLEEFRQLPPQATRIADGWVELFEDSEFSGHGLVLDYADRTVGGHDRLEAGGFARKASAARWSLPAGWRVRLYERSAPCGGRHLDLRGTGEHADFGAADLNDAVSCAVWMPDVVRTDDPPS